jgi:predicted nucleic acid-binding protein
VNRAADSSITVAALWGDHPAHETATEALATCDTTIAHVAIETYSVLTRLPAPHRAKADTVVAALDKRLSSTCVTLDASCCATAPARLAKAGVSGGATYDGLIALTALEHDLELLTRDRRAVRSYRALGIRFTVMEQPLHRTDIHITDA